MRMWVCTFLALTALGCRRSSRNSEHAAELPIDASLGEVVNDSVAQSAAQFTQAFYDWYARHNDRLETAVAEKPQIFGLELLTAIRADIDARSKSPGYIVGIDW